MRRSVRYGNGGGLPPSRPPRGGVGHRNPPSSGGQYKRPGHGIKYTAAVVFYAFLLAWIPVSAMLSKPSPELLTFTYVSFSAFLVFVFLFVLGAASFLFIERMVDNPHGQEITGPNSFHCFSFLEDGEMKVIARGTKFIRAIIGGHEIMFAGEKDGYSGRRPSFAEYWWAVDSEGTVKLPPGCVAKWYSPLSWWTAWVYTTTHAVFTGIYPFQGVVIRLNSHTRVLKKDGIVQTDVNGRVIYEHVENWSDHLVGIPFDWLIDVESADTRDTQKVGIRLNLRPFCVNPFIAFYKTKRWDEAMTNAGNSEATAHVKSLNYKDVLTSTEQDRYKFGQVLCETLNTNMGGSGKGTIEKLGFKIDAVQIIDYDPKLTPEQRTTQLAQWTAEEEGKAKVKSAKFAKEAAIETAKGKSAARVLEATGERAARIKIAQGDTEALRLLSAVVANGGDPARAVLEYRRITESAAAGKSTLIFGDSGAGGNNAMQAAQFAQMQKLLDELIREKDERAAADAAGSAGNGTTGGTP